MYKRIFTLVVSMVILATSFAFQTAQAQGTAAAKARLKVESVGVGSKARVEVKLHDGTKLKGYVSSKEQDGFTVTDSKSGASSVVRYDEVSEVKKSGGGGPSMKTWIILGSVAAGLAVTWVIVKPVFCDGGAQTRGIC
ncbi:MAG TPA: hypothetical protein VMS31_18765 [Pyrinomonadaceae bacterium]|nr:hypothetical protein [Pyrinomonadaceae bacterium]